MIFFKNITVKILHKIFKFKKNTQENITISKASLFYYSMSFVIVFGFLFFFNSNILFSSSDSDLQSTNLYQAQNVGTQKIELRSRKYNPITHVSEYMFYVENGSSLTDTESKYNQLLFEIREQANPSQKIESKVRRIDSDNYVLIAKLDPKWTVTSIAVLENTDDKNPYEQNIFDSSGVRFYSNKDNIDKDYSTKEKTTNEYLALASVNEIGVVKLDSASLRKKIDAEKNKINAINERIQQLESDRKYQTETELELTTQELENLKSNIEDIKNDISELENKVQENNMKIEKLNQKKSDLEEK
jgi:hypothetical protein